MSRIKSLPDSELVYLLREDNHSAYTELYNRYHYLLIIFAYKKLHDEEKVKDLVQELFTNLWDNRRQLPVPENCAAYLYKSLRNRILNSIASEKTAERYTEFLQTHLKQNYSVPADHHIRTQQLQEYIDKQINLLPKKMRKIFELSRTNHYTHKEIAQTLETSEYNVTKQISNALKILKTKLVLLFFL
ncbi:RNA polymerase sigma-70 factor [Pedobacter aquatilis]|uniref:RNA polymerase sigma-70 factor n=1 Tax=Pedobacter aquatilis TaxID=351343 RepID=UPI0025B39720|nr:RNA polymerase sigma-70 factor [Pedobacter aquatilis]MDN3588059.1 RNA polymerase sigma-70 factor [Pedobacter aquatilis]